MDSKTIINAVGIALEIIGAVVVWRNSPLNFSEIDGGTLEDSSDYAALERAVVRKNRLATVGVLLVIGGLVFQLMSNFL